MSSRALLERLGLQPAAASALAKALGIGEPALREGIDTLCAAGIEIDARDEGYALVHPLELLDADEILAGLSAAAREQVRTLTLEFETDSTQARAWSATVPERGCALWLAERQTAGQGRRGRTWVSPLAAHLYLSVSRRFETGLPAMSGLSLAVGVAIAETLREMGFADVGVKWPNDLWAEGKKLGGILVQLRGSAKGPCEAAIGMGINVRMPRAQAVGIDQPWIDLSSLAPARVISRNALASALLEGLVPALALFEREGLTPFLPRWRVLDVLAGRPVRVHDDSRSHQGRALGITAHGALRLAEADGERHYHGGEVSVRPV